MDRTLSPVLRALLDTIEPELATLGFRLDDETYNHAAFGSASLEYSRRGSRLRFTWDGKDRWGWMNLAPQPTSAFPRPDTYVDLDQDYTKPGSYASQLSTADQGVARGRELLGRLKSALANIPNRAV